MKKRGEAEIIDTEADAKQHRKTQKGYGMMFLVPNDEEGKQFLTLFKKFMRTGDWQAKYRGKHPERKKMCAAAGVNYNTNHEIPVKLAKWIGIYMDKKSLPSHIQTAKELPHG